MPSSYSDPPSSTNVSLGCFHCWKYYPTGCEDHRFTPLGYPYNHSTTSHGDDRDHQAIEGLTYDRNGQPHPDDIQNLSQENVAWPPSYTFSTLESTYKVSAGEDDQTSVQAGVYPAGTSGAESSNLLPMQPALTPSSHAPRFRSQVGKLAAAQASKMLRKKEPLYFCPFLGCNSNGFTMKHNFEYHCKAHRGIRLHVCEKCNKRFISKSDLRRHQRAKTLPCNGRNAPKPSH